LVLLILLGLEAMIAFPLALVLLILQQRPKWPELRTVFKFGLDPKILFLLYSVMLYKSAIEISGAAYTIFTDMQSVGFPPVIILIVLPALMSFAGGLSIAFAGVALPLLVPYFTSASGINSAAVLLAYVSGMIGLLLSPVHLCLILSAEYFKASMTRVYKYILPPALLIEAVAITIYLLSI
jgi:integral membrane protein (TIGR00529 family)